MSDPMKMDFGEEYPAAVILDGERMPLKKETRWTRYYEEDGKRWMAISRFVDGSASITLEELQREWPAWSEDERRRFTFAYSVGKAKQEAPAIMRHIMEQGGMECWKCCAMSIAKHRPAEEAFDFLAAALRAAEPGRGCNLSQGLCMVKHPGVIEVLKEHLARMWANSALWEDDSFTNWIAYDAITCIEHLIRAGAPPSDFEEQARKLAGHVCKGNRESWVLYLGKYYPNLTPPADQSS